jgi:hypothetical protein
MPLVAPAGLMRANVCLGCILERDGASGVELALQPLPASFFQRIDAVEPHLAAFAGLLARLGQADRVKRAQTHVPKLARAGPVPKNPTRAAFGNLQIQTEAVIDELRLRALRQPSDVERRQLANVHAHREHPIPERIPSYDIMGYNAREEEINMAQERQRDETLRYSWIWLLIGSMVPEHA